MWANFLGVDFLGTRIKLRKRKENSLSLVTFPINRKIRHFHFFFAFLVAVAVVVAKAPDFFFLGGGVVRGGGAGTVRLYCRFNQT